MAKIGYMRVSTEEQNTLPQEEALKKAGCEKIFEDKLSGKLQHRPEFDRALKSLQKGDTFVVWKFDRAGRSLPHLIALLNDLQSRGVEFVSLTENVDTTTSMGRLIFHIAGAFAQFERDLISERTKAAIRARMNAGKRWGRKEALFADGIERAKELLCDRKEDGELRYTITEVCRIVGCSKASLYRYIPVKSVQARTFGAKRKEAGK